MHSAKWRELLGHVFLVATLLSGVSLSNAYVWPNPKLDELESQIYDRTGYNTRGLSAGMTPDCSSFIFGSSTGRANVADWVRTAYHDMATHNDTDGTGGLDASIRFEEDRVENAGDGFHNTLLFINAFSNRYFSLSDTIALAAVTAIEMCSGPKIAYRGGRVDATEANAPGVPQPQDTIESHTASFARQGFTPQEMIGLVACGHSFGGVQNVAFPEIVDPSTDPENTSGNAHFDTTFTQFDNKVVTEYLDGTTANPLVVGHNVTTRSDLRIFSSDSNSTMQSFADASVFRRTCANLFAQMIDTVPSGVTLTDVIQPLSVKPVAAQLTWIGGGDIQFGGEVRFWDLQENPQRTVKLAWKGRDGNTSPDFTAVLTRNTTHTTEPLDPDFPGITSLWYDIPTVPIKANQSISNFWFEVDEGNGTTTVQDQGGVGFAIQDVIMLVNTTCVNISGGVQLSLKLAIRADIQPTRVYFQVDDFDATGAPILRTTDLAAPSGSAAATDSGYVMWSASVAFPNRSWNVAVDAGGNTYETTYIASGTESTGPNVNVPTCS